MADFPPTRTHINISYSHADAEHRERLHSHLAPYKLDAPKSLTSRVKWGYA